MYGTDDFAIRQLTFPAEEPLSLQEAKAHLRIDDEITDFDSILTGYLLAGRNFLESAYNVRLLKQTVEYTIDQFPYEDRIKFRIWPIQSIDYIRVTDVKGAVSNLAYGPATDDANVARPRLFKKPAELVLGYTKLWPTTILDTADAIAFGLTVGFQTDNSPETLPLPDEVKQAMRFLLEHQFTNGSAVTQGVVGQTDLVTLGVDNFMANVRLY